MSYSKRIECDKYGRLTVYRTLDEPQADSLWKKLKSVLGRLLKS